jgi:hypothetical protein
MLAVFEAASGKYDRQVLVRMRVGAAHARSVQHHGMVQQCAALFFRGLQSGQQFRKRSELSVFDRPQFFNDFGTIAVMRERMSFMRHARHVHDTAGWDNRQSDQSAGSGFQRQANRVEYQLRRGNEFIVVGNVIWLRCRDFWFGTAFPFFVLQ